MVDLIDDISYKENDGLVTVLQSEFQADSLMAYRMQHGLTELIFSADSDMAAHVGRSCVGIKKGE